jgi:malate dehydrogenase (oxaloacetate-decarboxylating)
VFIAVSTADVLTDQDVARMADRAIVFALANPDPEIDPDVARRHAAVVATGRSGQPNQINNVLAFPGIFRGLLDGGARELSPGAQCAAARAIADRHRAGRAVGQRRGGAADGARSQVRGQGRALGNGG